MQLLEVIMCLLSFVGEKLWKTVEKYRRFTTMFSKLGNSWEASEENLKLLEQFVCHLCEEKGKLVDDLRQEKFERVYCSKKRYKI